MINKIKDKQTGEYHDIGGLKCKLVEKVNCPVFEEIYTTSISYKLSKPLQGDKLYYLVRRDTMNDRKITSIFYNDTITGGTSVAFMYVVDDNSGFLKPGYCSYSYVGEHEPTIMIFISEDYDDFMFSVDNENDYLEIYELPFALEV